MFMTDWTLRHTYPARSGTVRWDRFGAGGSVALPHGAPLSSSVWRDVARVGVPPPGGRAGHARGRDLRAVSGAGRLAHRADGCLHRPARDVGAGGPRGRGAWLRRRRGASGPAAGPGGRGGAGPQGAAVLVAGRRAPARLRGVAARPAHNPGPPARTVDALTGPWPGGCGQDAFSRRIAQADQRHTGQVRPRHGEASPSAPACWGDRGARVPPERGREPAETIPGARQRTLEGAGRPVREDAPAQPTAALTGFRAERG